MVNETNDAATCVKYMERFFYIYLVIAAETEIIDERMVRALQ